MFYKILTYGCQMNEHESEKLSAVLDSFNFKEAAGENFDILIFNTCCIRETAEKKVFGHIGDVKKLKQKNSELIVAVIGCLPQQKGYEQKLKEKFPFIDIIIGTYNLTNFAKILSNFIKNRKYQSNVSEVFEIDSCITTANRPSKVKANVNIMYGCDNYCSYCIVPYVRGNEVSRDIKVILKEVNGLLNDDYKEITLLGQNVNSYKFEGFDFADLLNEITKINKKFFMRFLTSHPKDLSEKIVKIMSKSSNIFKSVHLPVQSGSDRILKLMNRKYTVDEYLEKIQMLKKYIPDVQITTDIIAGFPTETESDFESTLKLMEKVKFSGAFTFVYSSRSGTEASRMSGQIDYATKKNRIQKLIQLQKEITYELNAYTEGKTFEILVEDMSDNENYLLGKTIHDKKVLFLGKKNLVGEFIKVKIEKASRTALYGSLVLD
ncbi:MAG: tRNA (N6-isopentenyl adenosine(37)-C2)-methylthiotransferase MiaB [Firmicutes bacterium]|nr:tRNA (N6-isopentenyl adenosine(37)-C2)-methylthiotransferase MiaB [Bacillota bacterium]